MEHLIKLEKAQNRIGSVELIEIFYEGKPREAINAPWDGGISWKKDSNGVDFIASSCQGLGASVWWPNKDHQSDEPDSMTITVSAKNPLKIICNGNLRSEETTWNSNLQDSINTSEWFVSYPINNYNVTLNIGDYVHFQDQYITREDTLDLSYYVLSYNEEKAKTHFEQVKPMMECFESFLGKYPFWDDGYALVETPYLGMEHQSAIAYGNDYLPGYRGSLGYSGGLEFDYIIIHETGHEWWGNSITTNDIADMWIHEGFCTYSEALYVECIYGYDQMIEYVNNQKRFIRNKSPIVGCYHVNHQGSGDMYQKASVMLHTLRTLINDDQLWFSIIREISDNFKYKNKISSAQVKSAILFSGLTATEPTYYHESILSRDHTEIMLKHFGLNIQSEEEADGKRITFIPGNKLLVEDYDVVGDFSSAAFLIIAGLIASDSKISIKNVGLNPTRCGLIDVLISMGGFIEIKNQKLKSNEEVGDIYVRSSSLRGISISGDVIPNIIDEIPILSIAAAFADGETSISDAEELRVKESDRLQAISDGLAKINVNHELFKDGIKINGSSKDIEVSPEIDSHGDHRIAMSFLIASLRSTNGVFVKDCKNIFTSFPNFIEVMKTLGIGVHER